MFGLKLRGEANPSVVTRKSSLNACMYLSGVVHWSASLLFLLPSLALLVHLFSKRAMAVGKSAGRVVHIGHGLLDALIFPAH